MCEADAVYFDLDGTLTDPKPGITRSIRYALERLDQDAPPEDALTWCIGPPLRISFVTLVGEANADRAMTFYRERFGETGLYENALYPGILELLEQLSGRPLFLATSKPHVFAERILDHFGIFRHFTQIFGSELDGQRADKSELLAHALRQTRSLPSRSVMIGDREHDIHGARANGMQGWGVLYGYGSPSELKKAGAERVFTSPDELGLALRDKSWTSLAKAREMERY
jgi:phosphoglycolate phosphatase